VRDSHPLALEAFSHTQSSFGEDAAMKIKAPYKIENGKVLVYSHGWKSWDYYSASYSRCVECGVLVDEGMDVCGGCYAGATSAAKDGEGG
jgi:hypothetical protein